MPNPANPQSFNRYSYCLNNPLKYIDPSGHIVRINGIDARDIYTFLNNPISIMMAPNQAMIEAIVSTEFQAYNQIKSVDSYYTYKLEQTDKVSLEIISTDLGANGNMAQTTNQGSTISLEMNNNPAQGLTFDQQVANMAHELVHAYGKMIDTRNTIGNSQYEENLGDVYAFSINTMSGLSYTSPFVTTMTEAALKQKYNYWPPYDSLDPFPIINDTSYALSFRENLSNHVITMYNMATGQYPYPYYMFGAP